jgi:hypothetical protein
VKGNRLLLLLLLCPVSFPVSGQAPDITLRSTVSGNREQPKVMYILPWQQPSNMYIEQEFSAQLEGDLFEALDRDEFVRELNYQAIIDAAEQGSGE